MRVGAWITAALVMIAFAALGEEQRSFSTGGPGAVVSYLDAGGPGHPTGCLVSVSAGLPALSLSVNVFSNNMATISVGSQFSFLVPKLGSDAGIAVGSTYLFEKVNEYKAGRGVYMITIKLIDSPAGNPMDGAYKVINNIIYGSNAVSVVADDAVIASGVVPQQPGVGDALTACQQYMISRP